jgi:intracellular sulfur oxidation DsrE/DsrF family protein
MKQYVLLIGILMLITNLDYAQGVKYRVVFDMTSRDTINQQSLIREIGLIKDANPAANLEVVVYGQGLDLVVKNRSAQESAIQKIIADQLVSFKVCAMTLKRNNIQKDQLLPGVETVPDGIYEIISKQAEGWGYIKVAH